jgi:hypothetical protein
MTLSDIDNSVITNTYPGERPVYISLGAIINLNPALTKLKVRMRKSIQYFLSKRTEIHDVVEIIDPALFC